MIRATRVVKRGADTIIRPTVRCVVGMHGDYVIEAHDRSLTLRPKGCRRGGRTEVTMTWERVYAAGFQPAKRKRVRRGALGRA